MKTIIKLTSFILAFLTAFLLGLWGYQEYTSRNDYYYLSLLNLKTREKVLVKDNSTVHLVGMIHIATKDYYEQVVEKKSNLEYWKACRK